MNKKINNKKIIQTNYKNKKTNNKKTNNKKTNYKKTNYKKTNYKKTNYKKTNYKKKNDKKKNEINDNTEDNIMQEEHFIPIAVTTISNHIYMYTDITTRSVFEVNKQIQILELQNTNIGKYEYENKYIYLHIHSDGGDLNAGIALSDIIKNTKSKIITIIEGIAASAATIISIVGHKRLITKNSYMLIHQLSTGFEGKYNEVKDEIKNLNELMKTCKQIYIDHSIIPNNKLSDLLKHDLILNAEKCLKYGFVDEII